ncbi:patatin [Sphingobium indicum IP26]|uniref:Patatin n=1 Tax=Sphingobium indicum F2 TaxID=1450518 RepID=A0A8E1C419_9SPHN|nr:MULTISPECIES: patatin-like phospholipase family protein [Sphingobium]EPR17857.1 patatin [Sphingobium indicum IP26]EQB06477.1 patatin [Sphingobium sp. HDIP04]KER37686.1 patatin [Sphingobium indicum F2]
MNGRPYEVALVLGGGNALGAYQAGAYEALHDQGLEPSWIAGASAGAVNGAVICGNKDSDRVSRLRELWKCSGNAEPIDLPAVVETVRRSWATALTLASGHPGLFVPRHIYGPWWNPLGNDEPASLYDLRPLADTLQRLVDFDRLNRGSPRLSVTAVDIQSGEDIAFDTGSHWIGCDEIRASAALIPLFPPVAIGERLLGDAGISVNLPLDIILSEKRTRPLLCIAVDLLPLSGSRPRTLRESAKRSQDLMFATQSRRALAAWQALFDVGGDRAATVTVLRLAYADQAKEVAGKAFDFSSQSAEARWRAGHEAMTSMLTALGRGEIAIGGQGLSVYQPDPRTRKGFERVRFSMQPIQG